MSVELHQRHPAKASTSHPPRKTLTLEQYPVVRKNRKRTSRDPLVGTLHVHRGVTTIKRDTLIQDYLEGGMRCPDIQNFVWALYASWIPRIISPPQSPIQNKVLNIINRTYGHLKQDFRILASNCDFLQLPMNTNPFWKTVLQAWEKSKK